MAAELQLDGRRARLAGVLDRDAAVSLWSRLQGAALDSLEVGAVSALDSAGLALLVELAGRGVRIDGQIPGQAELAAAYRLDARPGLPAIANA